MILNFIIGLGAAFALFWTYRTRKLIPSVISLGMITGVLLVLLPHNVMLTAGLSIYIVFVLFSFIYGLFVKGMTIWQRIIICIMSATILLYWLWRLNHMPGFVLILPILSLLIGMAALISKVKLRNEAGFLVILAADAVAIIVENLTRLS